MQINNNFTISFSAKGPLSQITKDKISKALTGIKRSAQTRAKNAQSRLGKKASAETKAKLSASMKEVRKQKPNSYKIHSENMKKSWEPLTDVREKMSEFFTENSQETMREFREAYKALSEKQGKSLSDAYKKDLDLIG